MLSGVIRKIVSFGAVLGLVSLMALPAWGQESDQTPIGADYIERQNVDERLQTLGVGLMGDQVDMNTGSLSFSHVDVSLPGNSNLEVAIRRTISAGRDFPHRHPDATDTISYDFADWDLDVPSISWMNAEVTAGHGIIQTSTSCRLGDAPDAIVITFQDLGGLTAPSITAGGSQLFRGSQWANGIDLSIPGIGSQKILNNPRGLNWPSNTIGVTKDYWTIQCANQASGVQAVGPNGTRYFFDQKIVRAAVPLGAAGAREANGRPEVERTKVLLLATRVEDVNGNWVNYTYNSSGRLTRINANDGREITVSRNAEGLITSVAANNRTWTYAYTDVFSYPYLDRVTLPDGRFWKFEDSFKIGMGVSVAGKVRCPRNAHTLDMKHPDGMTGAFETREMRHARSDLTITWTSQNGGGAPICNVTPLADPQAQWPVQLYSRFASVTRKTLSGTNYPEASWTYTYSGGAEIRSLDGVSMSSLTSDNETLKWGEIIDPTGVRMRSYYYRQGSFEGLMDRSELFDANGGLVQTSTHQYSVEAPLGTTYLENENQAKLVSPRPLIRTTTTVDGTSYTTEHNYNSNQASASYSFSNPVETVASSTLQSASRITQTTYEHNRSRWILGLPKTTTRNGKLFDENTYDSLGRLIRQDMFGVRKASLTYHTSGVQAGQIATVHDALNREIRLDDWYRGTPRQVTRPDGVVLTRAVDSFGQLTSQSDAKGSLYTYDYDIMGRLTLISPPGSLASTNITYTGLGTGTLTQTATTGSQRSITKYDAMYRPYETRQQALSGGGGNIYTRTEFDALNRVTFQSFPQTSLGATTAGVETTYDGLGRVTQTRENVAPFATTRTQYLTGNRTSVIDPEGNRTITVSSGYGSPTDGNPTRITQPEGVETRMVYDIYGNLLRASRNGIIQRWTYDDRLRVCNSFAPETRGTRYLYDDANQVISYSQGHNNICGRLSSSARVTNTYDDLGRLTLRKYPSGNTNVSWRYDANGNATRIGRSGGANGVIWFYAYDDANQLLSENLRIDGRSYTITNAYNANGYQTSRRSPSRRLTQFAPDGFGRPTRALYASRDYATNVSYHPNGALKSVDYRNGYKYTSTLNARQQTLRARAVRGAVSATDFTYTYNANGQITAINDRTPENDDRTYTYDGTNRLVAATGAWGSASYTYDVLNNLLSKQIDSRTVSMDYDTKNRLTTAEDSADGALHAYTYDTRGNVIGDGNYVYIYDRANQPTAISGGGTTGSFAYDGNYKRVKQIINGETIYSVYSLSGELVYRENVTTDNRTDFIKLGAGGMTMLRCKNSSCQNMHNDHLGTPVAATAGNGRLIWREAFTPFGESLNAPADNIDQQGFTGHIRDTATGLTYMQARYYNPVVGRFLSNDPVGFAEGGVDYFNRYSYTANNPVNNIDPDGRQIVETNEGVIRAVVIPQKTRDKIARRHFSGSDSNGTKFTQPLSNDRNVELLAMAVMEDARQAGTTLTEVGADGKERTIHEGNRVGPFTQMFTSVGTNGEDLSRVVTQAANTLDDQVMLAQVAQEMANPAMVAEIAGIQALQVANGGELFKVEVDVVISAFPIPDEERKTGQ